jgi:hypothetical protein
MKVVLDVTYKYAEKGSGKAVWKSPGDEVDLPNDEVNRLSEKGYIQPVKGKVVAQKGAGK